MSDKRGARSATTASAPESGNVAALLRAQQLLDEGDTARAEREARRALDADRSAEAHGLLAEIARRGGDTDAAERHYRRAIQLEPRAAYLHHGLGNALQDVGRFSDAIDAYRRALRLSPQLAAAWNDLGTAYFAAGERERAVHCYRNSVRHGAGDVVAFANLGSALRALGDVRGALRAYRRELWQRMLSFLPRSRSPRRTLAEEAERWLARGSERVAAGIADQALREKPGDARALVVKAQLARRGGDPEKAIEFLEQALAGSPRRAGLWLELARAHRARGRHAQAAAALRKAIEADERSHAVQRELALTIADEGRIDEALEALERLARVSPDDDTWTAIGRIRLDRGDRIAAEQAFARALEIRATAAPALVELARLRVMQEKPNEALALCEAALESDPGSAAAYFWRGRALGLGDRWEDAAAALREAVTLQPANAVFVRGLAMALRAAGRFDEAEALLRDALGRRPGDFDLRSELVSCALDRGDVARAREMLERMLAEDAGHAGALAAMCMVLNAEGRLEEAEQAARRVLSAQPDHVVANQNLSVVLLKQGRYAEAWTRYEWRKRVDRVASAYLRFPYPEWTGETLAGKTLLVYAEQGLGDEIMFASCLPDLIGQARHVVVECDPRLGELFRRSFPRCTIFARARTQVNSWTRSLEPQPDFQVALASLGQHLRRDRESFPRHAGYLKPDPAKVERWRKRLDTLGPGRKIGLSWRGGLPNTARARRSLDLAALAPLLRLEGLRFVSLQYGNTAEELALLERLQALRVAHFQEAIDDYDEGAAAVSALDGVLSVCTSLVHLTGALGRPVLVMAPYSPEWRYGMSGEGMIWYPSARIVRQPQPGEWQPVLDAARGALLAGWGHR